MCEDYLTRSALKKELKLTSEELETVITKNGSKIRVSMTSNYYDGKILFLYNLADFKECLKNQAKKV